MPIIELETNVKVADSKALVLKLSKFSTQLLEKSESVVLVKYTHNESLCWGGTFDPAFVLSIISIGNFSPEKNESFIVEYTKFLKENLGLDEKRGYVVLRDPGSDNTGYEGMTVTNWFKKRTPESQ